MSPLINRRSFNVVLRRDSLETLRNIGEFLDTERSTKQAIIVVDPMTTGLNVAKEVMDRGYACISVLSYTLEEYQKYFADIPTEVSDKCRACIYYDGGNDAVFEALMDLQMEIIGVVAGSETGIYLSDYLSERLKVPTNGTEGSLARRNKYAMGEKIRSAGLRAVNQRSVTKWSEIVDFIENDLKPNPFQVIVKPEESAGSDDVFLCTDMDQVKEAYGEIQGKINHLGLENNSTLIQEYLEGTEYVVDSVSRNGKHKIVAVWEYDKRSCNGAPFVYYGVYLRAVQGNKLNSICDYVLKVLDALHICHGPSHAEVKYCNGEPCLIEIGSRCHGGSGTWVSMTNPGIGYNQVSATITSMVDEEGFNALPDRPLELKQHACEVTLVSYVSGKVLGIPGAKEVESMESFLKLHIHESSEIEKTVDLFTSPASIMLLHAEYEQIIRDHDRIRELEQTNSFFELEAFH